MEIEFLKEKVELPKKMGGNGREITNPATIALLDWLETDNKTLRFRFTSPAELRSTYNVLRSYEKRHNLDFTIYRRGMEIYLIKA